MSLRCWGHRPSGPPADPHEKKEMALETFSIETLMGVLPSSEGAGGMLESGGGGGCFSLRAVRVLSFKSTMLSSELENCLPQVWKQLGLLEIVGGLGSAVCFGWGELISLDPLLHEFSS